MFLDACDAFCVESHGRKLLSLAFFIIVCYRSFWILLHIFDRRKSDFHDRIKTREFTRNQDFVDPAQNRWVLYLFFQLQHSEQRLNAYDPHVPRVSGPSDLGFKVSSVLPPNHNEHGAVLKINNRGPRQGLAICGDSVQIDSVRISSFDLNNDAVPIAVRPYAIMTKMTTGPTVTSMGNGKIQSTPDLVHEVL